MQLDPNLPVTTWVLITFVGTVLVVGLPLLLGLLNYRRASREGQQKDIAALVTPIITALVKVHNEETYAHPVALARYVTTEQFNGALNSLREGLNSLRSTVEANEQQRKEDVKEFREDFRKSAERTSQDFRDLKANVSRAIGKGINDG